MTITKWRLLGFFDGLAPIAAFIFLLVTNPALAGAIASGYFFLNCMIGIRARGAQEGMGLWETVCDYYPFIFFAIIYSYCWYWSFFY